MQTKHTEYTVQIVQTKKTVQKVLREKTEQIDLAVIKKKQHREQT